MKAIVIGFGTGALLSITTDFHWYDWQWWALCVPIVGLATLATRKSRV